MTEPLLVLVESNTTGTGRLFARRARELGARPVLLAEDPGRYDYARTDGITVVRADTSSLPAVLAAVRALPHAEGSAVAGVTTSSDYFVPVAASAAAALGLPGPDPDAVVRCRHKGGQHAALVAGGVPVAAHALVATAAEALDAVDRIGTPVVLKPVDGSGSSGVRLCATRQEAAEHAARLLARTHNERGMPVARDFLVEEFVRGSEFSVEVFGDRAVAVVGKHLGRAPHFVEIGHDVPAPVADADAAALAATAVQAVKALGLGFGAAHVELRLRLGEPVLIEVNPRLAGGMIPELIRSATGVDLVRAQVSAALGLPVDLEAVRSHHARLRFLVVDTPARLAGPPDTGGLPEGAEAVLTGRTGVRLEPQRDHRDRVGHATATAPTAEAADLAVAAAHTRLRTSLRPDTGEGAAV
ncbi:ATP-grasp domain-containing protein [Streptomyces sp. ST1015]|uniref:ATP-grasp domain-containing protein n=1 Tax=unclassified Streptomyces TaxID=2593676 RepID=UPI001CA7263C|nr:ATP-grasp domain-containing protein [Streptomyces sp. ST1015]QZZ31513.1 ATP-grasp domain-containing protein [Streptomyces sp. ST1015]